MPKVPPVRVSSWNVSPTRRAASGGRDTDPPGGGGPGRRAAADRPEARPVAVERQQLGAVGRHALRERANGSLEKVVLTEWMRRGTGSGSARSTRSVRSSGDRPTRVLSKRRPVVELDVGHAAALRRVDASAGRCRPSAGGRHRPLAQRVLRADAAEPAVVGLRCRRPRSSGGTGRRRRPGALGADHLAVLEVAQREPGAQPAAGSAR